MNNSIVIIILVNILSVSSIVFVMYLHARRKFTRFTDDICAYIDELISNKEPALFAMDNETLDSKVNMKLKRLADVSNAAKQKNRAQKQQVQEVISDISHQLKTPIANLTMYSDTILNHELPREKELECMAVMQSQVEKLDFLVNALMKMSRLEKNIIKLKKEKGSLSDCIEEVAASISVPAKKKNIVLTVQCERPYPLYFDIKWTTEAIFNVMDNAVKYTPENGHINVFTERFDIFTKISIRDTGGGIAEKHINDIFKRFFRESKIHNVDGAGIGLYLTREIITRQGGYIKVSSKEGAGSIFAIYLPNEVLP